MDQSFPVRLGHPPRASPSISSAAALAGLGVPSSPLSRLPPEQYSSSKYGKPPASPMWWIWTTFGWRSFATASASARKPHGGLAAAWTPERIIFPRTRPVEQDPTRQVDDPHPAPAELAQDLVALDRRRGPPLRHRRRRAAERLARLGAGHRRFGRSRCPSRTDRLRATGECDLQPRPEALGIGKRRVQRRVDLPQIGPIGVHPAFPGPKPRSVTTGLSQRRLFTATALERRPSIHSIIVMFRFILCNDAANRPSERRLLRRIRWSGQGGTWLGPHRDEASEPAPADAPPPGRRGHWAG